MIKRTAETALTIPPTNEKTVEIFCTYLSYMIELDDFTKRMYAYIPA